MTTYTSEQLLELNKEQLRSLTPEQVRERDQLIRQQSELLEKKVVVGTVMPTPRPESEE